jgi:hypothetical protein
MGDFKIRIPGVHHNDTKGAAIIAVYSAGAVRQGDAVFQRQPRARPQLHFIALRDLEPQSRRHQSAAARGQSEGTEIGKIGSQIGTSRTCGFIRWQRQALIRAPVKDHLDLNHICLSHCVWLRAWPHWDLLLCSLKGMDPP